LGGVHDFRAGGRRGEAKSAKARWRRLFIRKENNKQQTNKEGGEHWNSERAGGGP